MTWIDQYSTRVPYTCGYYRWLSPLAMHCALESSGLRGPELGRALNYCELGMGHGVSLVAHAACFPHMHFYGVDANAAHANYARQLAADSQLDNVTVLGDSIEALAGRTLPQMDYIVLHGVYSWVSAACRAAIVGFIDRHLALGGVVYVSYNAMPGWAALMPLRDMLCQHGWRMSGQAMTPVLRAQHALAFLAEIERNAPSYFRDNPQAGPALKEGLQKSAQ